MSSSVGLPDRTQLVADVQSVLGVSTATALAIITAFDDYVARPLEQNLIRLRGRDLAKRNPMIYTTRGVRRVDEWVDRYLEDKETSAVEGHLGTWQEEVARIVSGGFKPGAGVELQRDDPTGTGVIELYAIQSAPNTKSAGGQRSDIDALRHGAAALRAHRRPVEMYIAVLSGRKRTAASRKDPNITVLASDDFWEKITGVRDFRARLLETTRVLSALIKRRASDEVRRIHEEAKAIFGDRHGEMNLAAVADPPPIPRRSKRPG